MTPHEYLDSFTNFETQLHKLGGKEFDLSRVSELLGLLGDPQKDLKIIHVAGTKGKGSTCAFLSHILAQAGYRVGLYTSPHLHRVNERIRILDKTVLERREDFAGCITDEQLALVVNHLRPHIAGMLNRGSFLTYFEVLTAAALYFFKQEKMDLVILEVGLGGRLDTTNAAPSAIAVITPVSLDHMKILGETIAKITAEKAGIIKNSRQQVVTAPQTAGAMSVIVNRCHEFGITPVLVEPGKYRDLKVPLKGDHQKVNAAVAVRTVELLRDQGYKINDEDIARGLKHTRWAGRFEVVRQEPLVIADGAHNAASARALAKTVRDEYPGRRVILVLGLSADKDAQAVAGELKDLGGIVILTKAGHARAYVFKPAQAQQLFPGRECAITANVKEALELALSKANKEDVIVVTGSLFIVAEARTQCTSLILQKTL